MEAKFLFCIPKANACQLFAENLNSAQRPAFVIGAITQFQTVFQKRTGCPRSLTQIICALLRNNHFDIKGDLSVLLIANPMKDASDIAGVANSHRRIRQRALGQIAQKRYRIEQIGLADAIHTGNAGKRSKAHVDINEILESGHF